MIWEKSINVLCFIVEQLEEHDEQAKTTDDIEYLRYVTACRIMDTLFICRTDDLDLAREEEEARLKNNIN